LLVQIPGSPHLIPKCGGVPELIVIVTCPPDHQVSWTQALRTIVKNCYGQHDREDLLYAFEDHQVAPSAPVQHHHHLAAQSHITHLVPSQTVVQTVNNPDGTVSLIQVMPRSTRFHQVESFCVRIIFNDFPRGLYRPPCRWARATRWPRWRTRRSCPASPWLRSTTPPSPMR